MSIDTIVLTLKSEPLALRTIAGFIVTFLATKGLDLNVEELLAVASVVMTFATLTARQKVTPVDHDVVINKLNNNALRGQKGITL